MSLDKLLIRKLLSTFFLVFLLSKVTFACEKAPQTTSVKVQTAKRSIVEESSVFVGSLEAEKKAVIRATYQGLINQIFVSPGNKVTAGTPILQIDNKSKITSPIDGVVDDIVVNLGEFVSIGTPISNIVNNQFLNLTIQVPSELSSQLKLGLTIEIIDEQNKKIADSSISFISPSIDKRSNLIPIKAKIINNSVSDLRNRQIVQAKIIWSRKPEVLIPAQSVTRLGGQAFVFVVEPIKSSQGEVTLGNLQGSNYSVISGINASEQIIISDLVNLYNGQFIVIRP